MYIIQDKTNIQFNKTKSQSRSTAIDSFQQKKLNQVRDQTVQLPYEALLFAKSLKAASAQLPAGHNFTVT